ncbi:MAG: 16S rRNA (adenine(1518)-N(6)/adenine(1519)-N(6))-dimethyltransferase RsmA [Chloroflexi bacterium]|nr:16S rRNA (adenine(1518)-N(6)/adenine(1519)-N(6))-dimethyltransferase RsmA [Chloroflexota bacterium]
MTLSPLNVPALLKQHGLRPNKRLGQNFLVDELHLTKILEAAGIRDEDHVLEVGPGLGSLSRHIAGKARRLVVVEIDKKFLPALESVLAGFKNVEIVIEDILSVDPANYFPSSGYSVVANIPYYLTSNLIRHLLNANPKPKGLALTVQREVAERVCAQPPNMSLLALSVQLFGEPKIVHHIPAGAFFPVPKVDSALLLVELFKTPIFPEARIEDFFRLAKAAFQQKRKTLANSLAALPDWDKEVAKERLRNADIDPLRRPQTLSLEEWGRLL